MSANTSPSKPPETSSSTSSEETVAATTLLAPKEIFYGYLDVSDPALEEEANPLHIFVIDQPKVAIGRETHNDLRFNHLKVSREQYEMTFKNDDESQTTVTLKNLSERKGTSTINKREMAVGESAILNHNDEFTVINYTLRWREYDPQNPTGQIDHTKPRKSGRISVHKVDNEDGIGTTGIEVKKNKLSSKSASGTRRRIDAVLRKEVLKKELKKALQKGLINGSGSSGTANKSTSNTETKTIVEIGQDNIVIAGPEIDTSTSTFRKSSVSKNDFDNSTIDNDIVLDDQEQELVVKEEAVEKEIEKILDEIIVIVANKFEEIVIVPIDNSTNDNDIVLDDQEQELVNEKEEAVEKEIEKILDEIIVIVANKFEEIVIVPIDNSTNDNDIVLDDQEQELVNEKEEAVEKEIEKILDEIIVIVANKFEEIVIVPSDPISIPLVEEDNNNFEVEAPVHETSDLRKNVTKQMPSLSARKSPRKCVLSQPSNDLPRVIDAIDENEVEEQEEDNYSLDNDNTIFSENNTVQFSSLSNSVISLIGLENSPSTNLKINDGDNDGDNNMEEQEVETPTATSSQSDDGDKVILELDDQNQELVNEVGVENEHEENDNDNVVADKDEENVVSAPSIEELEESDNVTSTTTSRNSPRKSKIMPAVSPEKDEEEVVISIEKDTVDTPVLETSTTSRKSKIMPTSTREKDAEEVVVLKDTPVLETSTTSRKSRRKSKIMPPSSPRKSMRLRCRVLSQNQNQSSNDSLALADVIDKDVVLPEDNENENQEEEKDNYSPPLSPEKDEEEVVVSIEKDTVDTPVHETSTTSRKSKIMPTSTREKDAEGVVVLKDTPVLETSTTSRKSRRKSKIMPPSSPEKYAEEVVVLKDTPVLETSTTSRKSRRKSKMLPPSSPRKSMRLRSSVFSQNQPTYDTVDTPVLETSTTLRKSARKSKIMESSNPEKVEEEVVVLKDTPVLETSTTSRKSSRKSKFMPPSSPRKSMRLRSSVLSQNQNQSTNESLALAGFNDKDVLPAEENEVAEQEEANYSLDNDPSIFSENTSIQFPPSSVKSSLDSSVISLIGLENVSNKNLTINAEDNNMEKRIDTPITPTPTPMPMRKSSLRLINKLSQSQSVNSRKVVLFDLLEDVDEEGVGVGQEIEKNENCVTDKEENLVSVPFTVEEDTEIEQYIPETSTTSRKSPRKSKIMEPLSPEKDEEKVSVTKDINTPVHETSTTSRKSRRKSKIVPPSSPRKSTPVKEIELEERKLIEVVTIDDSYDEPISKRTRSNKTSATVTSSKKSKNIIVEDKVSKKIAKPIEKRKEIAVVHQEPEEINVSTNEKEKPAEVEPKSKSKIVDDKKVEEAGTSKSKLQKTNKVEKAKTKELCVEDLEVGPSTFRRITRANIKENVPATSSKVVQIKEQVCEKDQDQPKEKKKRGAPPRKEVAAAAAVEQEQEPTKEKGKVNEKGQEAEVEPKRKTNKTKNDDTKEASKSASKVQEKKKEEKEIVAPPSAAKQHQKKPKPTIEKELEPEAQVVEVPKEKKKRGRGGPKKSAPVPIVVEETKPMVTRKRGAPKNESIVEERKKSKVIEEPQEKRRRGGVPKKEAVVKNEVVTVTKAKNVKKLKKEQERVVVEVRLTRKATSDKKIKTRSSTLKKNVQVTCTDVMQVSDENQVAQLPKSMGLVERLRKIAHFFKDNQTINMHFICPIPFCKSTYPQLDDMRQHLKNHRKADYSPEFIENLRKKLRPSDPSKPLHEQRHPQSGPSSLLDPISTSSGINQPHTQSVASSYIHTDFKEKKCPKCDLNFEEYYQLSDHLELVHPEYYNGFMQVGGGAPVQIEKYLTVHSKSTIEYRAKINEQESNLQRFMQDSRQTTIQIIKNELENRRNIKMYIQMTAKFTKPDEEQEVTGHFSSYCLSILTPNQINKTLKICTDKIENDVSEFTSEKSGLVLKSITKYSIVITNYRPLHASKYIDFPPALKDKRCFVNVNNSKQGREKCFLWSVLAHKELGGKQFENDHNYYKKNKLVKSYLPYQHLINDNGIKYPMTLEQIPKFEAQNPRISITVIGYDEHSEDQIFLDDKDSKDMQTYKRIRNNLSLLYNTKEQREIQIDLLLMMVKEEHHFVLIHNLSALLRHPNTNQHRYICRNCLQGFYSLENLEKHTKYCAALGLQQTSFPEKNYLKFNKLYRTQKLPFRFYADFESLLVDCDEGEVGGNTQNVQKHVPCGYAWTCIDFEGKLRRSSHYRAESFDEDVSARFVKDIKEYTEELEEEIKQYQAQAKRNMVMTEEQQSMASNEDCCLCKLPLRNEYDDCHEPEVIVRHHDHFPPHNFIGYAHQFCNLQARIRVDFPVFIHNGGNYDFHFLIKSLSNLKREEEIWNVEVIPKSSEKFLSVILNNNIRFVDSLSFTMSSLDNLVKTMVKNGTDTFKTVKQEFEGQNVDLLFQKGCYPYSYMKSYKNFEETRLPPKEAFYNDLSEEPLSDELYAHAQQVWREFNIQNMGEYHDLYVRLDTALLTDVMENTRRILYEKYELDIAHYFSIPMVALDAMLKITGVELEYIKDPTMHAWVEHAIRGGYCGPSSLRAAEANNKYMGDEYDPEKESSYLMYIDANNLYGWAMNQCLPTHGFKWIEGKDFDKICADPESFVKNLGDDDKEGYMFEVDLEIPEELHEKFNDYPPCPIKRSVDESELSKDYQIPLVQDLGMKNAALQTKKLIKDLHSKQNYICHYRILKTYLKMGCKIAKVHQVVKFQQSKWMKKYIDTNTEMRNMATTEFEKNFWKLMNNSAFGKMIEQKRKRQNVRICIDEKQARRLNKKPTVQSIIPIDEGLSIYLMKKLNVYLDKPIIVGVCILDLAKELMYQMHYDFIQPTYGDRARMVYTDTDSLIYHLKTEDMFDDMKNNPHWFDMSEYDSTHPIFAPFKSDENKKVLGKFKDETHNKIITKIAAVRPKMYAYRTLSLPKENGKYTLEKTDKGNLKMQDSESKRAKGINRTATKNQLNLAQYVQALEESKQTFVNMKSIQSKRHNVNTAIMRKKAINGFCNKRFSVDSVNSLAHGHKDIKLFF